MIIDPKSYQSTHFLYTIELHPAVALKFATPAFLLVSSKIKKGYVKRTKFPPKNVLANKLEIFAGKFCQNFTAFKMSRNGSRG